MSQQKIEVVRNVKAFTAAKLKTKRGERFVAKGRMAVAFEKAVKAA